jgi:hypothetical protein
MRVLNAKVVFSPTSLPQAGDVHQMIAFDRCDLIALDQRDHTNSTHFYACHFARCRFTLTRDEVEASGAFPSCWFEKDCLFGVPAEAMLTPDVPQVRGTGSLEHAAKAGLAAAAMGGRATIETSAGKIEIG